MQANEYSAYLKCSRITGEVKITVLEDALLIAALFDGIAIPYPEITGFIICGYAVRIQTDNGIYEVSRFEHGCEPFYQTFYDTYSMKVRKALFVRGAPILKTNGEYRYEEDDRTAAGRAVIEIYEDCVLLLPPDDGARRIPLVFVTGMHKDGYELTLSLDSGERYSFIRLGHDTQPFESIVAERLHFLRTHALEAVCKLDGSLTSTQASAIARMLPEGVAVPFGKLAAVAASFAEALEMRISQSRVASEYRFLKEIGDPTEICVGMKSGLAGEEAEDILWLITPGKRPGIAAVELALSEETAAATFIYRFTESWDIFCRTLNRAMEAVNFKREVIRLKEDELKRPEYTDYMMAVKRTAALQYLRSRFAGRVIHTSEESWQKEMAAYML